MIIGLHHHDHAEQDGNERGLVKGMRRQPRIACAMNWVPLFNPIFASQRPVPGSAPQHDAGVVGDPLVGSRHEAGRVARHMARSSGIVTKVPALATSVYALYTLGQIV